MEPIKVVRIEHPQDGKGFWHSKPSENDLTTCSRHSQYRAIIARHTKENGFPTYWFDEEIYSALDEDRIEEYKFAFNSIDQLNVAFTSDEIKECIQLGFKVLLLTVDDYVSSQYQTVFKNPVTTEDISQLYI